MTISDRKLLGIGIGGTVIAAICCFTPALVILLGALGLSALLAFADFVLLPALVMFAALTVVVALRLISRRPQDAETGGEA